MSTDLDRYISELRHTTTVAGLNYEIWWVYKSKDTRPVYVDPEVHTLVWPNGADFDPETLHNWPEYEENMRRLAKRSEIKKTQAM